MKKLEALIQPFQSNVVIDALRKHGIEDIVASEVMGAGPSQPRCYRGTTYAVDYCPKIKLEVVVGDECVRSTVDTITAALRTGRLDDASISVASVQSAVDRRALHA